MFNRNLKSRLERIDWDFVGLPSESPFSSLHWHPARLPSQVAATFIGLLSDPGDIVLDPFLGSGTTAVEAQRLGRRSIGIDINPISCMISSAKTLAVASRTISEAVTSLKSSAQQLVGSELTKNAKYSFLPETVQRKWYTDKVILDLSILWRLISDLTGTKKRLALMAFSGSLLPVCRETRHWGYVCDNSTPKAQHEGSVILEFCRLLDKIDSAYRQRDSDIKNQGLIGVVPAELRCADSREALAQLEPASVRLVVTSPPYFGVSDYVKAQRLTMEWMGLEIEPRRLMEIGARSKRHRQTAPADYLSDMTSVFQRVRSVLCPDGACVIILGESLKRTSYMDEFNKALNALGYRLVFKAIRNISQQRRQFTSIETEHITVALPK
jgi:DNA methylase